jgi:hypothetical protein
MPAGSQWENRMGTVRVNAPAGGTNRSSFIRLWSHPTAVQAASETRPNTIGTMFCENFA